MTAQQLAEPSKQRRMPLGLLLVERGILTTDQLVAARARQEVEGINLGSAVQALGFATAEQVTAAVAAQWSCPVFAIPQRPLSMPIRVPRRLLEEYEMLPVHYGEMDQRLVVGFVSAVQYQILSAIENINGCVAVPCFITRRDFQKHLATLQPSDRELVFDGPMATPEIAHLVHNYVNQIGARTARFGMCRDYLWIRMWGNKHHIDLLFRVQPE